jgi:hypothetical protein
MTYKMNLKSEQNQRLLLQKKHRPTTCPMPKVNAICDKVLSYREMKEGLHYRMTCIMEAVCPKHGVVGYKTGARKDEDEPYKPYGRLRSDIYES